jgi:hypothetical protein
MQAHTRSPRRVRHPRLRRHLRTGIHRLPIQRHSRHRPSRTRRSTRRMPFRCRSWYMRRPFVHIARCFPLRARSTWHPSSSRRNSSHCTGKPERRPLPDRVARLNRPHRPGRCCRKLPLRRRTSRCRSNCNSRHHSWMDRTSTRKSIRYQPTIWPAPTSLGLPIQEPPSESRGLLLAGLILNGGGHRSVPLVNRGRGHHSLSYRRSPWPHLAS